MHRLPRLTPSTPVPIRKHEGGFVAEGPGFFIWDEDPRAVLHAAKELARGNFDVAPTTRFMVVREDLGTPN